MKAWKSGMAMLLAVVMMTAAPLSVLAEDETTEVTTVEEEVIVEEKEVVKEEANEDKVVEEESEVEETVEETVEEPTEESVEEDTSEEDVVEDTVEIKSNDGTTEIHENKPVKKVKAAKIEKNSTLVSTKDATVTASYRMFKVAEAAKVNTYSDGSMTAEIIYTGSSFLKMYLGTAEEAGTATEGIYEAVQIGEKEYKYEIPVEKLDTAFNAAVLSSKGGWKDNTLTVSLVVEEEPEEPETPEPGDIMIPADGKYTVDVTTNAAMFKAVKCVLTVKEQKMTAVITLSGTGYDKLFMGSAEEAAKATADNLIFYAEDAEGAYTYIIPVESLDKEIAVASHSIKNDKWYDRGITLESATLKEYVNIPKDGTYSIEATSDSKMFKVVKTVLTVKDQKMAAVITLSGTGYDKLFMGSAEEAAKATTDTMISYEKDADGAYSYTIPLESLDKEIAVASHSIKNDTWYDRILTFESNTLSPITEENEKEDEDSKDDKEDKDDNTGVTDDEDIKDMIDSTNKGKVKDGTYRPSFGYKGGTGRTTLSCNKVVVKKGKATATIVFSSPNYTYMRVNGVKYYNVNKGGNSTFVIPVKLNDATTVYAETTAMSEAHEIQYVLYVYVNGTNVSHIKPATHKDVEESKKEAGEKTEETEENSWGSFGSEQVLDTEIKDEVSETVKAEEGTSSASASLPVAIVAGALAAVIIGCVIKRKSRNA